SVSLVVALHDALPIWCRRLRPQTQSNTSCDNQESDTADNFGQCRKNAHRQPFTKRRAGDIQKEERWYAPEHCAPIGGHVLHVPCSRRVSPAYSTVGRCQKDEQRHLPVFPMPRAG